MDKESESWKDMKKLGKLMFQKSNERKWEVNRLTLFRYNSWFIPKRKEQSYRLLQWFQKNKSITVAQFSGLLGVHKSTAQSTLDSFRCVFGLLIEKRGKTKYYIPRRHKGKLILQELWEKWGNKK